LARQYKITEEAFNDLKQIKAYSREHWGERKAKSYLRDMAVMMKTLALNPKLGTSRPEVSEGVRSAKQGKHVLLYEETPGGIMVLNILHESQELRRQRHRERQRERNRGMSRDR